MTENKRDRFADIKARLGMRVYTAAGPSGPILDTANWQACVTLADVEWLIAEVERLKGQAKRVLEVVANLRTVLGLCWKPQQNMPPAPEDEEVEFLCEVWGYGAVMSSAARLWARRDPTGAHTVGPCICTVKVALGMAVEEPDLCPLCDQPKHKSHSPDCPKARGEGIEAVTVQDVERLLAEVERLEQECRAMRDRAAGCDLDMSKSPRVWRDLDRLE